MSQDAYSDALANAASGVKISHPRCTGGSCRQGRENCATPAACETADDTGRFDEEGDALFLFGLAAFLVVVAIAGAVIFYAEAIAEAIK